MPKPAVGSMFGFGIVGFCMTGAGVLCLGIGGIRWFRASGGLGLQVVEFYVLDPARGVGIPDWGFQGRVAKISYPPPPITKT